MPVWAWFCACVGMVLCVFGLVVLGVDLRLRARSNYILQWLKGAREVYGVEIDYIGVWNERECNPDYVVALRRALDDEGFCAGR